MGGYSAAHPALRIISRVGRYGLPPLPGVRVPTGSVSIAAHTRAGRTVYAHGLIMRAPVTPEVDGTAVAGEYVAYLDRWLEGPTSDVRLGDDEVVELSTTSGIPARRDYWEVLDRDAFGVGFEAAFVRPIGAFRSTRFVIRHDRVVYI